jgi:hypothetical protein
LVFASVQQPWGEPSLTDAARTSEEPPAPFDAPPEPPRERRWLGGTQVNVAAPAVLEGKPRLCLSYAEVAARVVNGWYRTAFDRTGFGIPTGTPESSLFLAQQSQYPRSPPPVPKRGIAWRCTSSGLHLELHLPADDKRHQHADDALADILSALPWNGLDPTADELRIVVTLGETGDVATFDPAKG